MRENDLFEYLEADLGTGAAGDQLAPEAADYERLLELMRAAATEPGTEDGEMDGSVPGAAGSELNVWICPESAVEGRERLGALALTRDGVVGPVHEVWRGADAEGEFTLRHKGLPISSGWVWGYLSHLNNNVVVDNTSRG